MTPDRWQQIQTLFDAALEQPREARTAFLDSACRDEALRQEVVALLETYEEDPDFLEDPAASLHALVEPTSLEGQRIGPYRIVKRLGAGGMGAVYLAERDDAQFRKRVALKLVKRGMDTEEILRRFRSERQILAALDHPSIARLLDGGMTDDGRPYFVMEYVEGSEAINTYCDRKRLGVAERLRLFRQVCNAVQFAHQNLVVHRDLKPSNILVSERGEVKLLDFGIAKMLNPDLAPFTLAHTRTEMRLMTPEYAAPEQVRGEAVTTTTDVYQLGVLLYTLLTGHRPYRLKSRTTDEIARAICEENPERPSTVVRRTEEITNPVGDTETISPAQISAARSTEVERLVRRLSGDLDTIVLKAMHKEPQRRYISAEAFSDDVRRYLAGLPVNARSDTVGYRTRKFVRRHRMGVALTAAVFLLVLGFGVVMAYQRAQIARQAEELALERDRAQLEMKKSEEVTAFLTDLFKGSDPNRAQGMTAREMLDQGAEKIRVELEAQPVVKAQLLTVIGGVYRTLGLYVEAQESLDEAIALFRASDPHSDQYATGLLERANLHYRVDEYEAAEPLLREAVAIKTERFGPEHPEVVKALNTLGLVLEYTVGDEAAIEVMQRVVAIRRQQADDEARTNLPVNLANLANLLHNVGKLDEAESLYQESIRLSEATRGPDHPYIAFGLNSLASLYQDRGDYEAAQQGFDRAWEIAIGRLGETHPFTAVVAHNRGKLHHARVRYAAAAEQFEAAIAMYRNHIASPLDLAESLHWLGLIHVDAGHPERAEPALREALEIHTALLKAGDWRTAQSQVQLGRCLSHQGQFADAEPLLQAGYSALEAGRGREDAVTQKALQYLIEHYTAAQQPEQVAVYQALRAAKADA